MVNGYEATTYLCMAVSGISALTAFGLGIYNSYKPETEDYQELAAAEMLEDASDLEGLSETDIDTIKNGLASKGIGEMLREE